MKKKNLKYFLLFLLSMTIVAGVYMLANKMMFYPIMAIYQIACVLSVCVYIFLYMNNEKKTEKEQSMLPEAQASKSAERRKNVIKTYTALFLPFVVTVFCDYTYLLLLSEQEWFISLMKIFS